MHPNVNNNINDRSDNKITHTKKSDSQFSTDNIVVVVMYCIHSPNTLTSEKSMFASPSTHTHLYSRAPKIVAFHLARTRVTGGSGTVQREQ